MPHHTQGIARIDFQPFSPSIFLLAESFFSPDFPKLSPLPPPPPPPPPHAAPELPLEPLPDFPLPLPSTHCNLPPSPSPKALFPFSLFPFPFFPFPLFPFPFSLPEAPSPETHPQTIYAVWTYPTLTLSGLGFGLGSRHPISILTSLEYLIPPNFPEGCL